jgi:hypothetical protein
MAYVLPQTEVFQDFQSSPAALLNPLRAHIAGPNAFTIRYTDEDEKPDGSLGHYDDLVNTNYLWPNRPAGAEVDEATVRLYVDNGLLQYFEDLGAADSTIIKTAGETNHISSDSVNFADNGAFARDSLLLDRDVRIGDIVKARFLPGGGDPVTLWTYVNGLIGDPIAAIVAAGSKDADNPVTQGASTGVVKTAGDDNCVTLTPDGISYDGLPSGDITEVYTVRVLEGSVGGDFTLARLRIISASGDDDVASVVPSVNGSPTAIGTRGLDVTFADDDTLACSNSASEDDVAENDLIAGQEWDVTVNQAFTAPDPTSGGVYVGDQDTVYIIEVTRGGLYTATDKPQITVSTTNGIDVSGPTNIVAAATAVAVGSQGVTAAFNGAGLRKGDKYYIGATAEAEGAMRTIVLGNEIPGTVGDGDELDLTLYILKTSAEISQNRTHAPPLLNWDTSETELTVNSGIELFDESWTDNGVQVALPLVADSDQDYGELFVDYRAWLSDACDLVLTISDPANINDIEGPLDPVNPLKWGVFKALTNSNGTEVKYTGVCDPESPESWADVLELLQGRDDVYGLVPLTRDATVLGLYQGHVGSQSTPEEGLWRVTWLNTAGVPEITVVDDENSSDTQVVLATIKDDPDTSGTQYTIIEVPADNALFIQNDVRAGDVARALYTSDGFGAELYSEFVVDKVLSEGSLRLLTGPGSAVNVAAKLEIHRNLTATEEAAEIAKDIGAWNDRRVRVIWPDTIETSGTVQEGYHLCAALAGLSSGILPHQGMTNLSIAGFTDVPRTTEKFRKPQLDTIAEAGGWIVTQDPEDGEIYSRHAVTTGDTELTDQREEQITRNVDSISFRFKDHFEPFIGVSNVTPSMLELLGLEAKSLIEVLKTENFTQMLGGQLIDATILELRQHATLKDRVVMILDVDIPVPLNNLEVRLQIVL